MKQYVGHQFDLVVVGVGIDDRAMAVRVNDSSLSTNDIPHITLAVNRAGGGKPFHSNKIPAQNWKTVSNRLRLTGTVQEVPRT